MRRRDRHPPTQKKTKTSPYKRNWDQTKQEFKTPNPCKGLAERVITMSEEKLYDSAAEKLIANGFDPLDHLVVQAGIIDEMINDEIASGNIRTRYITDLITLRIRILESALPYRYTKATNESVDGTTIKEPIRIILTDDNSASD